jgi:hypothetical protein
MDFTILVIPYMVGRGENVRLAGSDPQRFHVLMERLREQMQFAESVGYTCGSHLFGHFALSFTHHLRYKGDKRRYVPCMPPGEVESQP